MKAVNKKVGSCERKREWMQRRIYGLSSLCSTSKGKHEGEQVISALKFSRVAHHEHMATGAVAVVST